MQIQHQFSLNKHNSFGIHALAHQLCRISDVSQLSELKQQFPNLHSMPKFILGGGSNVILSDYIEALVLLVELKGKSLLREDEHFYYVQAQAGENWHDFVLWTLAQGWGGLENLSLIPGTVGAAPIQNIGAYGVELKDYFYSLEAFDFETGLMCTLDKDACQFAYRDSVFKQQSKDQYLIVNVTFALPKLWQAKVQYGDVAQHLASKAIVDASPTEVSTSIMQIRQSKLPDPAVIGNAGSFFKNPLVSIALRDQILKNYPNLVSYPHEGQYKLAAGWLIEQCQWKGKTLGNVGVYEKQALVLVNRGGASGVEVRNLAKQIQADVLAKFGVNLEVEPVFI